jgi:CheY-like chemotaxis protein
VTVTQDEQSAPPGDGDTVRLLFTVKDDGIGIAEDRLGEVFEAFSQVGQSSHAKYGGTGLGLSISRSLVEMMNGRIWVDSEVGRGSTFSFTAEFRLARGGTEETPPSAPQRAPREGRRLSILLAEDNGVNRLLAVSLLEIRGHTVTAVENGQEALAALAREVFDAVLMDVRMPDMDGEEATRRIRNGEVPGLDPGIPIIALTAHALKGDRERFLAAGMDDYAAKPLGVDELDRILGVITAMSSAGGPRRA